MSISLETFSIGAITVASVTTMLYVIRIYNRGVSALLHLYYNVRVNFFRRWWNHEISSRT